MQIAVFILVFLSYLIPASAEVYKYTDENGILFFVDSPDKIPEGQRHTAEKVETDRGMFNRWIDLPVSKVVLILLLIVIILSLARYVLGRSFPRILMILLIILLFGTMFYSIFIAWNGGSAPIPFDAVVEPYLPTSAPINRAKEGVEKLEESQKNKEDMIDKLQEQETERH